MKKILKYNNILIVIIFAFAFVAFCYATCAGNIEKKEKQAINNSSNLELFLIYFNELSDDNIFKNYYDYLNAYIQYDEEVGIYTQFTPDTYSGLDGATIMFDAFDFGYPLYKGTYPTREQVKSGKSYAVISMSSRKQVYQKNGIEYIDINGTSFEVTGYFSKYSEWMFENKILLVADIEVVRQWQWLSEHNLAGNQVFTFCSNNSKLLLDTHKKCADDKNISYYSDVFMYNDNTYPRERSIAPTEYQIKLYKLLTIICLIVLLFAMELQFYQRKKEFEILNKNGFSVAQILFKIYCELISCSLLGIIFGACFIICLIYYFEGYVEYNISSLYDYFVISILYLVGSVAISSSYSVSKMIIKFLKR